MSEQELWKEFYSTGSVDCYLQICRLRQEGDEADEADG